jgi:hypothetical protein
VEQKSKREVLKEKIVKLVKEFMVNEGGIDINDLWYLFGTSSQGGGFNEVASALANLPILFNEADRQ